VAAEGLDEGETLHDHEVNKVEDGLHDHDANYSEPVDHAQPDRPRGPGAGHQRQLSSPRFEESTGNAFVKVHKATKHTTSLFLAIAITAIHIVDIVTDAWLSYELLAVRKFYGTGSLMVALHIFACIQSMVMDYFNNGRWTYAILHMLHMTPVVKLIGYVQERKDYIGIPWENNDFRSHIGFEHFPYMVPCTVVQVHLIVFYQDEISLVQIVSFISSVIAIGMALFRYFKFVSLSSENYFSMLIKGMLSTGLRVVLCALIVLNLGYYVVVWVFLSYCFNIAIYFFMLNKSRSIGRDDPLVASLPHALMAHIVASKALFLSFPFATNHRLSDWWLGYLVLETKIQIENAILVTIGVFVAASNLQEGDYELLVAALFGALMQFLLNFILLWTLHKDVAITIVQLNYVSGKLIVKHWAGFCAHYKSQHQIKPVAPKKKRKSMMVSSATKFRESASSINLLEVNKGKKPDHV
jgi:hypothetical protein